MSVPISKHVVEYVSKSYAGVSDQPFQIDCSLGIHYEAPRPQVMKALKEMDGQTLRRYPGDLTLVDQIVKKYKPVVSLTPDQITLGDGSYDLLGNINLMYLLDGKTVFSYAPHFSAYTDHTRVIGANHIFYALDQQNNYEFIEEEFLRQMEDSGAALVQLENPNNPTGQVLPLDTMERIVKRAKELNMAVLVDEAYGDYMPLENSAAVLTPLHDHLYVTRSLSKGYGLAGIRVGYAITSPECTGYLQKLITPFNCNSLGRVLAAEVMKDDTFIPHLVKDTQKKKAAVLQAIQGMTQLKVAKTHADTPILLLYTPQDVDLWALLREFGLNSVSGLSYEVLGKNSVRIMMCEQMDVAVELLKKANAALEEKGKSVSKEGRYP